MSPYFDPAFPDETDEEIYSEVAAAEVQRLAPVPDPEPADYAAKAARAEKLIYDYLLNSQGGSLSSVSAVAGSVSFNQMSVIRRIVRSVMSSYYRSSAFTLTVESQSNTIDEAVAD